MAFRETDPGPMPDLNGGFFKFEAIGDKLAGLYVGVDEKESNFKPGKKEYNYTFKTKDGNKTVTANFDLNRRMQASIKAGMKPGCKVLVTYSHEVASQDPTFSPMKGFKVMWDDAPAGAAAPTPPPPPKPAEADPFEGI